ncbi:MAG: hypothetical protein ACJA0Q_000233 [Saprospiraceae bacterium]
MEVDAQHIIKEKLNGFIKRYYLQQITQGLLSTFAISCGLWLCFASLAYFYYLSTELRFVLMSSLVIILGFFAIKGVVLPVLKLFRIGKRISDKKAAQIIGTYFKGEIDDKLLNAIYLLNESSDNELILASIQQKSAKLSGFNFLHAIPIEQIKKALKIALIPAGVFLLLLALKPSIISTGTHRIVAFNTEFVPDNPYHWELLNTSMQGVRNEPFELTIQYIGLEIPIESYIKFEGKVRRLIQGQNGKFTYTINHLTKEIDFKIKTGIYQSKSYQIQITDRPKLSSISINIAEPSYLGGRKYEINDDGNLSVPEGSIINWKFNTVHSDSFFLSFGEVDTVFSIKPSFSVQKQAITSIKYKIMLINSSFPEPIRYEYELNVISDEFPAVTIKQEDDSSRFNLRHLHGVISDDHGFSALRFHYLINDSNHVHELKYEKGLTQQQFFKTIDFNAFSIKEGKKMEYYFEVVDNDGINGGKSVFSSKLSYSMPSKSEKDSTVNKGNDELKTLLANAQKESKALQMEYHEIKKLLLEKKNLSWQEKEKINDFLSHQKSFEKDLMSIQKANKQNNSNQESLTEKEKKLLEKQLQINRLFDELMDEETKKLFNEIEKLMEEVNQEKREEKLEEMNLSNENMEKSLDRALELFKQMEFEQRLDETLTDLKKLIKEQDKLAEETKKSSKKELENVKKKQEELKKEFERLKNKLEDLKNKNDSLENKQEMENTKPEEKKVSEEMKKSMEKLTKKQKKGAGKNQKSASDEMKKMSKKLSKMQQKMSEGNQAEDLSSMRQLLENLIFLSVEQEKLLKETKKLNRYGSKNVVHTQQQKKLKDDAEMIEDSLFALSKRQPSLASYINKEIHEINFNQQKSLELLADRKPRVSAINQQFVMTSANNLALILDESIQNMQNDMMKNKFGQGSCNKPGGSNPKPGSGMKSLQKMLSKQLEEMRKALKKQGSKPGKDGKKGKTGAAKSFGKMAAEQSAIKEQLQKLSEQLKNQGNGGLGNAKQLENQLDETQKELLNKRITPESIRRQQEILTRLLEAEKAMKERDYEEKRISKKGKNTFNRNPTEFLEYTKTKKGEEEMLKITLPSLKIFYKKKVNEYFNAVEK